MGEGEGMNEEMNPHSKPVMRMVICPLNGWHPLSACNICEHHLGIHTNVDTLESEVSCGYIAAKNYVVCAFAQGKKKEEE